MIGRRLLLAQGAAGFATAARGASPGGDGLLREPWFLDSFLELPEDLAEAVASGRCLAVLWELPGCSFCTRMHRETFADPEVAAFMRAHVSVVQLDIAGAREVMFTDGVRLPEKAQSKRMKIVGTPTLQVFGPDGSERGRLEGFVPPGPFLGFFRGHGRA